MVVLKKLKKPIKIATKHKVISCVYFFEKAYESIYRRFPDLADFIREKILFRFTIASSRKGK